MALDNGVLLFEGDMGILRFLSTAFEAIGIYISLRGLNVSNTIVIADYPSHVCRRECMKG